MKLIGILAESGSGKSTASDWFKKEHRFEEVAYADPMKRQLQDMYGFSEAQLWGSSEERNVVDPRTGISPRVALQKMGDFYREQHPRSLLEYLNKVVLAMSKDRRNYNYHRRDGLVCYFGNQPPPSGIVVSDLRKLDEVENIRAMGGKVVRLVRKGVNGATAGVANHVTEVGQRGIPDSAVDKVLHVREGLDQFHAQLQLELTDWA